MIFYIFLAKMRQTFRLHRSPRDAGEQNGFLFSIVICLSVFRLFLLLKMAFSNGNPRLFRCESHGALVSADGAYREYTVVNNNNHFIATVQGPKSTRVKYK